MKDCSVPLFYTIVHASLRSGYVESLLFPSNSLGQALPG